MPFSGPVPIADARVAVWQGRQAAPSGPPLQTVQADAEGFFVLDLPPGVYAFRLVRPYGSMHASAVVTVTQARPVAAGVIVGLP